MGATPTARGVVKLFIFNSAWVLAPALPLVSLLLVAFKGDYTLLALLVAHAAFRKARHGTGPKTTGPSAVPLLMCRPACNAAPQVVPGDTWEPMRRALSLEKTPYYRSYQTVRHHPPTAHRPAQMFSLGTL